PSRSSEHDSASSPVWSTPNRGRKKPPPERGWQRTGATGRRALMDYEDVGGLRHRGESLPEPGAGRKPFPARGGRRAGAAGAAAGGGGGTGGGRRSANAAGGEGTARGPAAGDPPSSRPALAPCSRSGGERTMNAAVPVRRPRRARTAGQRQADDRPVPLAAV